MAMNDQELPTSSSGQFHKIGDGTLVALPSGDGKSACPSVCGTRKTIAPPAGFPLFGWTPEATKAYIEDAPLAVGDPMIIFNGQAGQYEYVLARVVNPASGRQKRIVLDKAASFGGPAFFRSGKNCWAPGGQSRMLPPVPDLMAHLSYSCTVMLDHTARSIAARSATGSRTDRGSRAHAKG